MGYVFAIKKSGLRPQSKEGYTSLQNGLRVRYQKKWSAAAIKGGVHVATEGVSVRYQKKWSAAAIIVSPPWLEGELAIFGKLAKGGGA